MYVYIILRFMHKYVNNVLPSSFNDKFFKLTSYNRSLSFQMEVVKKLFLKTIPTYSLHKNWNSLPLELNRIKQHPLMVLEIGTKKY